MKKILTGLAVGVLAVAATGAGSASAAGTSVYDQMTAGRSTAKTLIDASGLASQLDDCGNTGNNNGLPDYTVFFPSSDAIFGAVLAALDLTLGELAAQPALVKTVLLYHVHGGNISPSQLADNSNTSISTLGGLTLTKTTQIDGIYIYPTWGFDDTFAADWIPFFQAAYAAAVAQSTTPEVEDVFTEAQFVAALTAGYISEYATSLPTKLSFYINGYKVANLSETRSYTTDYNTWYVDGVTEGEFFVDVQLEIIGIALRVLSGQTLEEALKKATDTLKTSIDVADDEHTGTRNVVGPTEACNGWVYLINGILSTSTAAGSQGTSTSGQGQAAAGATGEIPATGAESLALTYAALASLIAGAGLLVIRRRSVA